MTVDIRNARFYMINEDDAALDGDAPPFEFDAAFDKATALAESGQRVKVLYTEDASQIEVTRFVTAGVPTELISGG